MSSIGKKRSRSNVNTSSSSGPSPHSNSNSNSEPTTEQGILDKQDRDFLLFQLKIWLNLQKRTNLQFYIPYAVGDDEFSDSSEINNNFGHLWPLLSISTKATSNSSMASYMNIVVRETWMYAERHDLMEQWGELIKNQIESIHSVSFRNELIDPSSVDTLTRYTLFDSPWVTITNASNSSDIEIQFHHSQFLGVSWYSWYPILSPHGWRNHIDNVVHKEEHIHTPHCCTIPKALRLLFYRLCMLGYKLEQQSNNQILTINRHYDNVFDLINLVGVQSVFKDWVTAPLQYITSACGMDYNDLCRTDTELYTIFTVPASASASASVSEANETNISKNLIKVEYIHSTDEYHPLNHLKFNIVMENMALLPDTIRKCLGILMSDHSNVQNVSMHFMSNLLWKHGCLPVEERHEKRNGNGDQLVNYVILNVSYPLAPAKEEVNVSAVVTETENSEPKKSALELLEVDIPSNSDLRNDNPVYVNDNEKPTYTPLLFVPNESCVKDFPNLSQCTPSQLSKHPECVETCDKLMYDALDSIIQTKSELINKDKYYRWSLFSSAILNVYVYTLQSESFQHPVTDNCLNIQFTQVLTPNVEFETKGNMIKSLLALEARDISYLSTNTFMNEFLPEIWTSVPKKLCHTLINILKEYPEPMKRGEMDINKATAYYIKKTMEGALESDCIYPKEEPKYNELIPVALKIWQSKQEMTDDQRLMDRSLLVNLVSGNITSMGGDGSHFFNTGVPHFIYLLLNKAGISKDQFESVDLPKFSTFWTFYLHGEPQNDPTISFDMETGEGNENIYDLLSRVHVQASIRPSNFPYLRAFWTIMGNDTGDTNTFDDLHIDVYKGVTVKSKFLYRALYVIMTQVCNFHLIQPAEQEQEQEQGPVNMNMNVE